MRQQRDPGSKRRRGDALGIVLVALASMTCFHGDDLEDQPCAVDEDCNPSLDVLGDVLACEGGRCRRSPFCGDGIVNQPSEACDDGNLDDSDACTSTCAVAFCGDGLVHAGVEACDDGDDDDEDLCLRTCVENVCGDGLVDREEEGCDDGGDDDDNDGCSSDCWAGPTALGSGPLASHMCALRGEEVRCWGANGDGQLGIGNTANLGDEAGELPRDQPVELPGVSVAVSKVVGARNSTCVLLGDGRVRCWGLGIDGMIGDGQLDHILVGDEEGEKIENDVVLGGEAVDVVAGGEHACALLKGGGVRCWGLGFDGQLGYGFEYFAVGIFETPADVGDVSVGGAVRQITAGGYHTCALLESGEVRCWGLNSHGQLGYPDVEDVGLFEMPSEAGPVDLGGAKVTQIVAGSEHTCAVVGDADARCWGRNLDGSLGTGTEVDTVGKTQTPAVAGVVKMLAAGDVIDRLYAGGEHTCALLVGGGVRCWGHGWSGQLGYGAPSGIGRGEERPGLVDTGGPVRELALGFGSTCALLDRGRVRCWGRNSEGALGLNTTTWIGDGEGEMPPKEAFIYRNPAQTSGPGGR